MTRIVRPVAASWGISSPFGAQECGGNLCRTEPHNGTDYKTPTGTPLLSPADGRVRYLLNDAANGLGVGIEWAEPDGANIVAAMIHLDSVAVKQGETVRAGQVIGRTGNSGNSTGPHLHMSMRRDGARVDPEAYLRVRADAQPDATSRAVVEGSTGLPIGLLAFLLF